MAPKVSKAAPAAAKAVRKTNKPSAVRPLFCALLFVASTLPSQRADDLDLIHCTDSRHAWLLCHKEGCLEEEESGRVYIPHLFSEFQGREGRSERIRR